MENCFRPATILLPGDEVPVEQWACLACDQFTSQPEYWQKAEAIVRDKASALHIVLPELYLEEPGLEERIEAIHKEMERVEKEVLTRKVEGFIYLERDTGNGFVRQGLIGAVDLEAYDYSRSSKSPIRPTEGTVVERIAARLAVRRGALLETPHVMMLVDDERMQLIEPLAACKPGLRPLYSGRLMLDGGSVRSWAVEDPDMIRRIQNTLEELGSQKVFDMKYPQAAGDAPIVLASGDGNHSLATAKAYWEELKPTLSPEEQENHPARYCLVEVCNLESPAIQVEPIHRVLFGAGGKAFVGELEAICKELDLGLDEGDRAGDCPQQVTVDWGTGDMIAGFHTPTEPLSVGTVEQILAVYLQRHPEVKVDYIHGATDCRHLANNGAVALLLPDFNKSDIFRGVVLGGVLPRKTFSMGRSTDKRYYLECRRIRP